MYERVQLESGEGVELLFRWRLGFRAGWQRGWLESGKERHGTRIWSWRRDGAAGEWRWR
jgi:hypothetical protein